MTKMAKIKLIPDSLVKKPKNIPPATYIQEANNLYQWCSVDRQILIKNGLDAALIDDLPVRIGAFTYAESIWNDEIDDLSKYQEKWLQQKRVLKKARSELAHKLRYAFKDKHDLLSIVRDQVKSKSNASLIQGLYTLAELAKNNSKPLQKINFDFQMLTKSYQIVKESAEIAAKANSDKKEHIEPKELRNRYYTHLKQAVDKINESGKHVFWEDKKRLKGYGSEYLRQVNQRSAKNKKIQKKSVNKLSKN